MKRLGIWVLILSLLLLWSCKTDTLVADFEQYFSGNQLEDSAELIESVKAPPLLILGEHHGVADNYEFYQQLIAQWSEQPIQLVLEMSPSFAYLAQSYLDTGDEALLHQAIEHLTGTLVYSEEFVEFWKGLKSQVDAGKTLRVIGVDQEFQLKNMALALMKIDPERFEPELARINRAAQSGDGALIEALKTMVKEQTALASDDPLEPTVQAIMQSVLELTENPQGDQVRDQALAESFKRQVDPDTSLLGIFGGDHVTKSGTEPSMVQRLLKEPELKERLSVAQLFYIDSEYMASATGDVQTITGLSKDSIMIQVTQAQTQRPVIYRLPESELFTRTDVQGMVLPELYDYAVIFFDAQAMRAISH